ncbi:caspase activity and apoptosis inhibitor 1 isoform X3 [Podarcis raffonei]|uniref:caspase activity and apoptosis inhibitor 1 isoform X3 n=1 Tax=Podarcis raffonei TaxID=65483 RepID=UPI0023296D99|nr:caspase activity and apoptosis inhibitor 1 isoform X3 [Podarcis raffonei]
MTGRKFPKEKKRHRSRLGCLDEEGGGSERKRRSIEPLQGLAEVTAAWAALREGGAGLETKCTTQIPESEDVEEESSDLEEGGLDLSVQLKPVSFYITDKKEMLHQCFCIIGEKKVQKMLPDVLKGCSIEEIKRLCLEQLELLSEKKLLRILEGENENDSDSDEEASGGEEKTAVESISQQDNSIDSTSSLKEDHKLEALDSKQVCDAEDEQYESQGAKEKTVMFSASTQMRTTVTLKAHAMRKIIQMGWKGLSEVEMVQ